mgnify:FL=1|tara:strand:- start:179 stop:706 length:528 start_codon:yes stop_codon:yes gene_type:complete
MSDEENEVFSGSVTSEPQMVNVQTSGPMYVVERSSAPQVIGILVIVYNLIMTALGLFGLAALAFLSDLDEVDGIEALPFGLLAVTILLTLIPAGMGIFGGYKMFMYKKQGLWLVLGSIVLGWVIGIVNGALTSDYGGTGDAALDAGLNGVCGLACAAICGIIVCIPLFMANNGLE